MARRRQRKVTPIQLVEWDRLRQIVKVLEPATVHEVARAARDIGTLRVEEQLTLMCRVKDLRMHRVEAAPIDRFLYTLPDTEL